MKRVCAVVMVLCLLLTGCSGVSKEMKERSIAFEDKCNHLINNFSNSFEQMEYTVEFEELNVEYENDENSLSKVYVTTADRNGNKERLLISFLDIYCDDEYQYFQIMKKYINFIDDNVIDFSGENQYIISINATDTNGSDISIQGIEDEIIVTYNDRHIKSAYSNRINNMELSKEVKENIALPGLIKFSDLPNDVTTYSVGGAYEWYKLENGDNEVLVTYIDDGTYSVINENDTEKNTIAFLEGAYTSMIHMYNEEIPSLRRSYYFAYKSGEVVGIINFSKFNSDGPVSSVWSEKYDFLNTHHKNTYYLYVINAQL